MSVYDLAAHASSNWVASNQFGDGNNFALYAILGVLTKSPIPEPTTITLMFPGIAFLLVVSRRLHAAANQPTC